MRHITLEYHPPARSSEPRHTSRQIDRAIALQLDAVSGHCPLLRTFELHLLSSRGDGVPRAVDGRSLAADALQKVVDKVQERLALVVTDARVVVDVDEDRATFPGLRTAVVAAEDWTTAIKVWGCEWSCDVGELRRRGLKGR